MLSPGPAQALADSRDPGKEPLSGHKEPRSRYHEKEWIRDCDKYKWLYEDQGQAEKPRYGLYKPLAY
jgi:hypothetical protein